MFQVGGKWSFVALGMPVYFRTLAIIVCYGAHKQGGIRTREGHSRISTFTEKL